MTPPTHRNCPAASSAAVTTATPQRPTTGSSSLRNHLVVLAVLATGASLAAGAALTPPNLERTLAAPQALVEREPTAERFNDLGNLLLLGGRVEDAREAYEEAIGLDPELVSAHFNLALLLQQENERRQALRHLREVIERDPEHARAWFQIGFLHELAGAQGPAVRAYARAFALDPRLSFADENPQVLDSDLVTQSLFAAEELAGARVPAPRSYEEPRRIASLLLPAPPPADAEKAPAEDALSQGTERSGGVPIVPVVPGLPADPLAANRERVLGPNDLQPGSRTGEVSTAPGIEGTVTHLPEGGGDEDYGELLRQRLMQQEEMRRLEEAGAVTGQQPPAYYTPGTQSTGRVEQRLEDQLAARLPAAPPRG